MPLNTEKADFIRLTHMYEAAQQALDFSKGKKRDSLDTDLMYRRAVVHCIQEIGEAAKTVTEPTRQKLPAVPWKQIVGMRHNLVHVYFSINLDAVWQVITKDLEPLLAALSPVVQPDKP